MNELLKVYFSMTADGQARRVIMNPDWMRADTRIDFFEIDFAHFLLVRLLVWDNHLLGLPPGETLRSRKQGSVHRQRATEPHVGAAPSSSSALRDSFSVAFGSSVSGRRGSLQQDRD